MRKISSLVLALAGAWVGAAQAQYADAVVAYAPGSGFNPAFTNAAAALGEPSRVNPFGEATDPFNPPYGTNQIVSVGAGGSLTVHLATPATSDPLHPFGLDLLVFGHAGFTITNNDYSGGGLTDGSLFDHNLGGTRVSVSADGLTYYALNPAVAPTVDGWFPTDGAGQFTLPVDPALTGGDFAGQGLAGIRARYAGSGGGAGFALAWAQDSQGHSVALPRASFVRVEVLSGKAEIDAVAVVAARPTFAESFAQDPRADGWRVFGDTNLFQWEATNHDLRVTWDSAQPNSYFYHPLGTVLTRQDDFALDFDLRLDDVIGGAYSNKPSTFSLTLGFQDFAEATSPEFLRGTGTNSPDLVEFGYFPDTGFGATVWPGVWSTNSALNYNGSTDYTTIALPTGIMMHVSLSYAASNQTLVTTITTNGIVFGPIGAVKLSTNFTEFHVDTVAIPSYSDAGQDPQYAGSLLAHGVVANLAVLVPPPPVRDLGLSVTNGLAQARFNARTNWVYTLQRTTDWRTWSDVTAPEAGPTGPWTLADTNAPSARAFYRVRATRP